MSKNPTALYLQGGPGLNCAVERFWFGDSYSVLWWDQPRFPADTENAYQTTLDAAAEKLTELVALNDKPIHVIGWSFGARLALDLAHRAPDAIGALTLLAPTLCLETAIDRIADHTALSLRPTEHRPRNHEEFMQRAMAVLSIPDLFSHYWAPTSAALFERHSTEAARTEWFDLPTFTALSREIINRPNSPQSTDHPYKIRIIVGRHDPYFDPEIDPKLWQYIFPEAAIQILDKGHMIPFEVPTADWLNSSFI